MKTFQTFVAEAFSKKLAQSLKGKKLDHKKNTPAEEKLTYENDDYKVYKSYRGSLNRSAWTVTDKNDVVLGLGTMPKAAMKDAGIKASVQKELMSEQAELDEDYAIYYKGSIFDTFDSMKDAKDAMAGMNLSSSEKKDYKIRKIAGKTKPKMTGKMMKEAKGGEVIRASAPFRVTFELKNLKGTAWSKTGRSFETKREAEAFIKDKKDNPKYRKISKVLERGTHYEQAELDEASTKYVIKHKKTKEVLNTHDDYATAKDEHEGLGAEKKNYGVYKQTKKDAALRNRNTYREEVELDEMKHSKENVNESNEAKMVRIGQKMIELAPKEKNDMISNAYAKLGDALTRYGTNFGPKDVKDLEKKTGLSQRIIMDLVKRVQK